MLIPRVKIESMGHGCQKQSVVDGLKMNGERNNPHSSKGRYAQATVERLQAVVKARAYEKKGDKLWASVYRGRAAAIKKEAESLRPEQYAVRICSNGDILHGICIPRNVEMETSSVRALREKYGHLPGILKTCSNYHKSDIVKFRVQTFLGVD